MSGGLLMNNVELSEKVRGYLKGSAAKAKKFEDLVAVTISLISENTEDMYVAVRNGEILVDAYHYDDNNCSVEASAETVDKLFSGELSFDKALADGEVKVKSGETAKFKALEVLVPAKKAAKKAEKPAAKPAKVPEKKAEKPAAPKAEVKPEVKAAPAPKAEKKPEAPAPAAKPAAPAAPAKPEVKHPAPAAKNGKKK